MAVFLQRQAARRALSAGFFSLTRVPATTADPEISKYFMIDERDVAFNGTVAQDF